jgi:CBS domain containing-hemolysin-like protein
VENVEALTSGSIALRLGVVFLLVFANGFFVAAEFALVGARRSKVDAMIARGDSRARTVRYALTHLDRYISGTQLGITLASLALGWLGEPALAAMIDRLFGFFGFDITTGAVHTTAAITIAFLTITFLHIVLGELAPKTLALVAPEGVSRWVAPPLIVFSRVMSPFIWLLNGTANLLLRPFGVRTMSEAGHVHSAEELRLLVVQAREHGTIDATDSAMLAGVFDFHQKRGRDVMRPRTEVVALPVEASEEEVRELIYQERYSRYPVYEETLDNVVGLFVSKDLLLYRGAEPFALRRAMREPLFVPDSRAAERVMEDLRKTRAQMAIVLDEYGGTAGIITLEDLVEEVVGDIADEYDVQARRSIETEGVLEVVGSMSLVDVRSDYGIPIPEGSWSTLGGYVFSQLGRVAAIGDRVTFPGGELEVVAVDGRRVAAVRVLRARADVTS